MDNQHARNQILAPFLLGVGLALGANTAAFAFPDNSRIYSGDRTNYHRRSFRDVQPFRSLNVTPRYYIPLPDSRYQDRSHRHHHYHHRHDRYYYEKEYRDRDHTRERRVHRRDYRVPTDNHQEREYGDGTNVRVRRVHRRDYRNSH